ncbi:MAG: glucosiduronase [Acidobacteria bacterium]|nr:glucosiduronase [Acidobacteriota bacterium]
MRTRLLIRAVVACFFAAIFVISARAEDGHEGWLRYAPLDPGAAKIYAIVPRVVVVEGDSSVLRSAQQELSRGIRGMLAVALATQSQGANPSTASHTAAIILAVDKSLPPESFRIRWSDAADKKSLRITGGDDRGVLYGVFALLSKIARVDPLANIDETQQPSAPVRWVNDWDNLDGTIERGYGGRSIFFDADNVRADLSRANDYARLLASIGINGCAINNVNVNPRVLTAEFLPQLMRVADIFRAWGVRLAIAVDVSSPMRIGGLDTFDPLDPTAAKWWRERFDQVYGKIPDLGGVVVKADSEGRLGPSTYHRSPADAANVIARALKPHRGLVFYRAFVYNHHLDWRDPKNDRAKAAYDNFHPLDGQFDDNVVIQIKHGPIDFQAREPASPLFSGLEKTNEAIELQITQEYTGQQHHVVFLAPMWKEVLDFDMHAGRDSTPVKDLVAGKVFHRPIGGYVGIANVGLDANWLAHPLAMANLYAFGRLAWNPDTTPQEIATEWTQLTFGDGPTIVQTIAGLQLASWRTYENYTGPLGAQTLTDITGSHYGPNIESSEENGWGQWHRADEKGIGMDRTVETGTGFVRQYRPQVAKIYESLATTPDQLLLFFHHVPYTYDLHSGKTVIQYIYDSHYEGAAEVAEFVDQWKSLQGHVDAQRFNDVLARLEYQSGHAIVWRDAICNYFLRKSGIPDAKGRAGHFPNRVEAESMQLQGYASVDVTPWENASGGKAVTCQDPKGCRASYKFTGAEGKYSIAILYFDQKNGESKFHLLLNGKEISHWIANNQLPATKIGADAATLRNIANITLHPGDEIRIEGIPDGDEPAGLDYIEITPQN